MTITQTFDTGFRPSQHGFPWSCKGAFPGAPDVLLERLFHTVWYSITGPDLMRSVVMAACDYWHAVAPVPADASPPAPGTPLYDYIVARGMRQPPSPGRLEDFMWRPDAVALSGLAAEGWSAGSWSAQRMGLLQLVTHHQTPQGSDPPQGTANLFVLAYAGSYSPAAGSLRVYDPGSPGDDGVLLSWGAGGWASLSSRPSVPVRAMYADLVYRPLTPPA